jgi:tripartite-type tricarboxylate transporter receptor subunit TctC
MSIRLKSLILSVLATVMAASFAYADPVADFYRGKSITILISAPAGSGYDAYARLLARHLGRFVPGHPSVIAQNKPGAGGLIVANTAANTSPRDGTTMFTLHFTIPLFQALGGRGVRSDAAKFSGIGRLLASNVAIGVMKESKANVTNVEDAKVRQSVIGTTGGTSNATLYPVILNNMIGTKFKIVQGYQGQGDVFLALDRGEIDGFGSYSYLTFKSVKPDYLTRFYPIVQWGEKREEAWPDTPTAIELAINETDKRAMEMASSTSDIGFSYFLPPGVPPERVAALQNAFDEMVKDPAFLADAKQADMYLRPKTGKQIEQIVKNVLAAPQSVINRLTLLMSKDGKVQCDEYTNNSLCKTQLVNKTSE